MKMWISHCHVGHESPEQEGEGRKFFERAIHGALDKYGLVVTPDMWLKNPADPAVGGPGFQSWGPRNKP